MRQHVNPLSTFNQVPLMLAQDWLSTMFANPTNPFWIDVGSCTGLFAIQVGLAFPNINVLGLEIRGPMVERSLSTLNNVTPKPPTNVNFLRANANVDIRNIMQGINQSSSSVQRVLVQMPDPWFKAVHKRRRVVTNRFVRELAEGLPIGGEVFVQSDVIDAARDMRKVLLGCSGCFVDVTTHSKYWEDRDGDAWLTDNPNPVQSEREKRVLETGVPVYRALFKLQTKQLEPEAPLRLF